MLTIENVNQILEEHEVFSREPQAREQNLQAVLLSIGETRARVLARDSRLEDGIFAAWAICLPIFPQSPQYTDFMRNVRWELFQYVTKEEVSKNAATFFHSEFLKLGLDELERIVIRPTALYEEPPIWTRKVTMFDASMLQKTRVPALGGVVYL